MNNDSAFTASGQSAQGQLAQGQSAQGHSAHTEGGFTSPSHEQASQLEKMAADMRRSLMEHQADERPDDQDGKFQRRDEHETTGPLREIMHRQDSLYKYLNWEDPLRTIGSYFLALGVLSAAHYFPWTRTALKYASIALGVVSFTEFSNRLFTKNTVLARLRPAKYSTLDESTLNATLKDVHDLLQHLTIIAQKTILGEDLSSTFICFATLTSLYLFSSLVSPFGLAILALTTAYIVPLFNTPRGKEVARNAQIQAEKIGNAAAENGKVLAQQGQEKLSQGYAMAQDGAAETKLYAGNVLSSGKQTAANASHNVANASANASNRAADAAVSTKNQAGDAFQSGKQTAANLTNKASDAAINTKNQTGNPFQGGAQTASNAASRAQELGAQGVGKLPFVNNDYVDSTFGTASKGSSHVQGSGHAQGTSHAQGNTRFQGSDYARAPEDILDHSKVKSDLQGGVDKTPF